MPRLRKLAEAQDIYDGVDKRKIGYALIDILPEVLNYTEFLNLNYDEYQLYDMIESKNDDEVIKAFINIGGIKQLFDYVKQEYNLAGECDSEAENYIKNIVLKWYDYTNRSPFEAVKDEIEEAYNLSGE